MSKCEKCKSYSSVISCTVNEQGEHHSFNDEPSMIYSCGTKYWHKNGDYHRDNDLPSVIYLDGNKYWYKNSKLHRTSGPATHIIGDYKLYYYKGKKVASVNKLSETTFQYKNQVGLILEHIEDKIYLGLFGDIKTYIFLI